MNTRSPGTAWMREMRVVAARWASEGRGSSMPTWRNTYWTYAEQSKPVTGLVPPYLYARPSYRAAMARTAAPNSAEPGSPALMLTGAGAMAVRSVERLTRWVASRTRSTALTFGLTLAFALALAVK